MKFFLLIIIINLMGIFPTLADNTRIYDLSQFNCNKINIVAQDSTGFVWVGTDYGLNRFDGIHFIRYNHRKEDKSSLLNNVVQSLLTDRDKRLWVGTNNGLQYYDPDMDSFVTIHTEYAVSVTGIVHLRNGQIWFITSGRGVWEVDVKTHSAFPVKWLNDMYHEGYYTCIYQDTEGRIWLGNNKGLVCANVDTRTNLSVGKLILNEQVSGIGQSADSTLYVATSVKLLRLKDIDGNPHFEEILNTGSTYLVKMYIAQNGTIYLGTNGQGLKYIISGMKQIQAVIGAQLPDYVGKNGMCNMIMEDKLHNLWISYAHFGLIKYSRQETSFRHHGIPTDNFQPITAIVSTPDAILCGFMSTQALVCFDKKSYRKKEVPIPTSVRAIFADRNQTYWIGTYFGGLFTWRVGDPKVTHVPVLSGEWINAIADDEQGNIYLSVFGKGLKRYHPGTHELYTFENNEKNGHKELRLNNDWINVLLRDSRGMLWIGHHTGINMYDTHKKKFVTLPFDNVPSSEICQALLEDHKGNIWIGTKNALYKYTLGKRTLQCFTITDGLSNDVICNLQEDAEGNIWCSTLNGINQIMDEGQKIVCYYAGNGLQDNTYYTVGCRDDEGHIYFGGHKGITDFDPAKIMLPHFFKPVTITNMYINGKKVNVTTLSGKQQVITRAINFAEDISLNYYDNTLAFDLSTMDFRPPENIYYEYCLSGFDGKWNATASGNHEIIYHNLPPGDYTLQLRACENNAKSEMKEVKIMIAPPWYQTGWAKAIYLLIVVAMILQFLYVLKKRRRDEINEAKLQFFINIAHEIRSPMTLVISPLEALLKREQDPITLKALTTIHRNTNRIIRLMNQLLDIRKIDKGQMRLVFSEMDLVSFVHEQIQYLKDQAKKRNIKLTFEHYDEDIKAWIDPQNFDKVLLNLLENALKYTPDGGEVTVRIGIPSIKDKSSCVCIEVMDTGTGIEPDEQKKIFERFYQIQKPATASRLTGFGIGLNLCRLLVHLHHGTIEVKNRTDRSGSDFIVCLPLGNQHLREKEMATNETTPFISEARSNYADSKETPDAKQRKRTNFSLLIVDDEEEIRNYITEEMEKLYRMHIACNGKEGIKMALKYHPDIIISDVIMPEMDGFELLRTLKNNYETSHIPVVLLTSKTEHVDRITAFEKGADIYLPKPFNIDELDAIVANLINNRLRLKGKFAGKHPQDNSTTSLDVKDNDMELIRKIMEVVDRHIGDQELAVEKITQEIGISRAQLHRRLKEIAGISAGELIRNVRLTKAAQLLKEQQVNVSQLAYAVGYTSQSNFSTAFKKYFGVSPKEYAEQLEKHVNQQDEQLDILQYLIKKNNKTKNE
ncbi:hybrid sensor histidine kinase/response regulator transcription factor [Dysgonomonas macrotermitis]|uniref:histidine kinase n=1 Tax=Dysgonomonas macrotermitis TaxID=1346286 RepID=A0A1M5JGY2_9BACT|nr:hybrid sensor histidine kinase/response regulator transcription factor [Dysgonomonas macrotermitis]SHG39781.1 Signal transduction histidine kinase [Dysgonomonas macrotermitis]